METFPSKSLHHPKCLASLGRLHPQEQGKGGAASWQDTSVLNVVATREISVLVNCGISWDHVKGQSSPSCRRWSWKPGTPSFPAFQSTLWL